jgi:hypothetical protein
MLLPDSLDIRLIALRSHEDENNSCCSEDFEGLFFHELCTQIIDLFFLPSPQLAPAVMAWLFMFCIVVQVLA